jgi:pyruvate,water dikinase
VSENAGASSGAMPDVQFFNPDLPHHAIAGVPVLGGKGINLCKMMAAGFPVPPGFVLTTEAYRRFLQANGLGPRIAELAASIDPSSPTSVDTISAKIRALFADKPVPPDLERKIKDAYRQLDSSCQAPVAVRSSATAEDLAEASFAGQQDTYLNIRGEQAVIGAVRSCWGSLWTARAVAYRAKQKVSMEGLALAVVVQQMVEADSAGVMFTVNPVTGARDELVINAAWGLGEAIVSGHVMPDTIVADKATGHVRDLKISEKVVLTALTALGTEEREITDDRRHARVLSDDQVRRLVETGRKVEEYYGSPQDMEWAFAHDRLYLLQARPVTALPEDPAQVERVRREEIERIGKLAGDKHHVWVLHNLSETLPMPTPLTWDIVREFMSGNGGFGQLYRDLGYMPSKLVAEEGFLELVGGRIYADPERAADLFFAGMPKKYDVEEVAKNPKLIDSAPEKFAPERADAGFLVRLPKLLMGMFRSSRLIKRARKTAVQRFEKEVLPPYLAWVKQKRGQDLKGLPTAAVIDELDARVQRVLGDFGGESLKPGFFGCMGEAGLSGMLTQLMGQEAGASLALTLTQGLEGDTTMQQAAAMFDVARGNMRLEEFVEAYGHRGVEEMELSKPRWREDTGYVRKILSVYGDPSTTAPAELHKGNVAKREAAQKSLPDVLVEWGGSAQREDVLADVEDAQAMLPYRESGKHYLMMGYETIRSAILELSRRWDLGDGVFFLQRGELRTFEQQSEQLKEALAQRRARWQLLRKLEMGDVVDSRQLDKLGLPEPVDSSGQLKGDPVATGVAEGIAQLVLDPNEAASLCTDYVLVCRSTDPAWTALFVHARALVVEKGGVLSHGAIVARDYGIPAVVCPNAMRNIPHGARIRVDGNRGTITVLQQPGN